MRKYYNSKNQLEEVQLDPSEQLYLIRLNLNLLKQQRENNDSGKPERDLSEVSKLL